MKKTHRGGAGKGPQNSKGKGKNKRDIKNARSLRDVLGLGDSKGKGAPDRQPARRSGVDSGRESSERIPAFGGHADAASSRSSGGSSDKITTIVTFQPPKERNRRSPEQTRRGSRAHRGATGAAYSPPARAVATPSRPPLTREGHETRGPSSWPRERVQTVQPPVAAPPVRFKRGKQRNLRITGVVKRHPDGYGFLLPDNSDHPDVYISRQSLIGIMTNDRVEVEVFQSRKDSDRLYGEVIKVISRGNTRIVGRFLPVDPKYGVILDEGRGWGADLRIATQDSMGAKEGDMVAVEITRFPDDEHEFAGRVVSIIGDLDDPINDVKRVIYAQGIPVEFSEAAINEARKFGGRVTEAETSGREDLRDLNLITIDGVTAKDFDDAIYVERADRGFRLLVGIADVSHYVKPGTPLDNEAYERGTSTYFPNYVVPMLPEELSNDLCSLKPRVTRLCFACEMEIDFEGVVRNYRFFEGVMESKARVTYGEAQDVLDGQTPHKLKPVENNIRQAGDLAKILMQKRYREGSLDLEIPETQVVVDSSGETVDIIRAERLFAHRLIEELMLVTNICTARFMENAGIPGIYRIHEEPKEDNIRALERYLWNFGGGSRSLMGDGLQKKLTKTLQSLEGRPGAQVLNILTLRAMNQAMYSPENIGHFGLGFSHYSHFTSPIRRYPDLIAHRLIKSQLYPRYRNMEMSEDELASASTMLSACEQRSVKAERQVISIKKARFMRRFEGEEFEGLISSVTKFGVFVLLRQYDVDGLVKIEELGNDRFIFDEENLRLLGKRSGLRYAIGDRIRVTVRSVDPMLGRIDFGMAQEQPERAEAFSEEFSGAEGRLGPKRDRRKRDRKRDHERDERGVKRGPEREPTAERSFKAHPSRNDVKPGESTRDKRKADKADKKTRNDVQERRAAQDDRRRVRKKRVSKRR